MFRNTNDNAFFGWVWGFGKKEKICELLPMGTSVEGTGGRVWGIGGGNRNGVYMYTHTEKYTEKTETRTQYRKRLTFMYFCTNVRTICVLRQTPRK